MPLHTNISKQVKGYCYPWSTLITIIVLVNNSSLIKCIYIFVCNTLCVKAVLMDTKHCYILWWTSQVILTQGQYTYCSTWNKIQLQIRLKCLRYFFPQEKHLQNLYIPQLKLLSATEFWHDFLFGGYAAYGYCCNIIYVLLPYPLHVQQVGALALNFNQNIKKTKNCLSFALSRRLSPMGNLCRPTLMRLSVFSYKCFILKENEKKTCQFRFS